MQGPEDAGSSPDSCHQVAHLLHRKLPAGLGTMSVLTQPSDVQDLRNAVPRLKSLKSESLVRAWYRCYANYIYLLPLLSALDGHWQPLHHWGRGV